MISSPLNRSLSALARGVAAAALLGLLPAAAFAFQSVPLDAPVTEQELAADIRILASDAFEGRAPGTAGEMRTIAHVVGAWAAQGLQPLTGSATPWLQPVPLAETEFLSGSVDFRANGRAMTLRDDEILVRGRDAALDIDDLPVVFAGYGVNRDGRVNMDVKGKIALVLLGDTPFGTPPMNARVRREALTAAGAVAVLHVATDGMPWSNLAEGLQRPRVTLDDPAKEAPARGFLSIRAFDTLAEKTGYDGAALRSAANRADYRGVALPLTASIKAASDVRRFDSHNIMARLPGRNPDGKAVVILGHWDHLGICRPDDPSNRICNGAVDNASGIAALIAVAKRLADGPALDRDVIFLATTAEESGLLGAQYFVANPPVPLENITAAFNLDTIAIAPRGTPVAVIGRGRAAYDAAIRSVVLQQGRIPDDDGEADSFLDRQDGAAFTRKNVPSFMVGSGFSDMTILNTFLSGPYHQPDDEAVDSMVLGGAAEDSDLHVALIRLFADRSRWDGAKLINAATPAPRS